MPLTRQAIEELKEIHQRETGQVLTDDQAWEMGRRLLRLFGILLRQSPRGGAATRFDPSPR